MVALLITAGNGPLECALAVEKALARLVEEAEAQGIALDISTTPAKHGLKSAVVMLHGPQAGSLAARWHGTLLWRAPSPFRPHHKRANWFIGVFDLGLPPAAAGPLLTGDVRFESFRAGGPGGQHQNTTDSAVRAIHLPSGLAVVSREARSQHRNKAQAMERLAALISAQAQGEAEQQKAAVNQLHLALERGNPARSFQGERFREVGRA